MAYIMCPWCARKIHLAPRAYIEDHRGRDQFRIGDRFDRRMVGEDDNGDLAEQEDSGKPTHPRRKSSTRK